LYLAGQRSTIAEIKTKYKLHPSLAPTVYVEGSTDKSLLQWFIKQTKIKDVIVLEIKSVEIPNSETQSLKLEDNHRNRIIALTTLIKKNIIGIIDSDFNFLEKASYKKNSNLLETDYANMEMYLYNEENLDKIFLSYKESKQSQDFLTFNGILIELFLISYAKKKIKNNLSQIDFSKNITLKSNQIIFDGDSYLAKYLQHNKELIKEFDKFINGIKKSLPTDKRKIINGHHFVELLYIYLEIKQKDAKEIFTKSLYASFEYATLKKENMFTKLVSLLDEQEISHGQ